MVIKSALLIQLGLTYCISRETQCSSGLQKNFSEATAVGLLQSWEGAWGIGIGRKKGGVKSPN